METPNLSSEPDSSTDISEGLDSETAERPTLSDDYDGPVTLPPPRSGIRFLSLSEVPEPLRKQAIPVKDTNEPKHNG